MPTFTCCVIDAVSNKQLTFFELEAANISEAVKQAYCTYVYEYHTDYQFTGQFFITAG